MDCKHITELQIKVSYNHSDLYDQRKFYIFIETEFCYAQTSNKLTQGIQKNGQSYSFLVLPAVLVCCCCTVVVF